MINDAGAQVAAIYTNLKGAFEIHELGILLRSENNKKSLVARSGEYGGWGSNSKPNS